VNNLCKEAQAIVYNSQTVTMLSISTLDEDCDIGITITDRNGNDVPNEILDITDCTEEMYMELEDLKEENEKLKAELAIHVMELRKHGSCNAPDRHRSLWKRFCDRIHQIEIKTR